MCRLDTAEMPDIQYLVDYAFLGEFISDAASKLETHLPI